jgi:cytidylate kinase
MFRISPITPKQEDHMGTRFANTVAVDGPAGSGKSICRRVAKTLGLRLLPSGDIYRAATWIVMSCGINPADPTAVISELDRTFHLVDINDDGQVVYGTHIFGDKLKSPEISNKAPLVSAIPRVREMVMRVQHRFADNHKGRIIAEGRDMTSVVFKEAGVLIFLDADLDDRAKWRHTDYLNKNPTSTLTIDEVRADLARRDEMDMVREHGPLIRLPNATYIRNSSDLTIDTLHDAIVEACFGAGFKIEPAAHNPITRTVVA